MNEKQLNILKSSSEIQKRVQELGKALTTKFKGKEPVLVCVLSGSFVFFSDLSRAINLDVSCEFLAVSGYRDERISSGEVTLTLDLSLPLEGKDVVLVEDLVDTGLTMSYLIRLLGARNPLSLTTVALLSKPEARKIECKIDLVGFEIPNEFVVGYGIDHAGYYRNLPHLAVVKG